MKLSFQAIVLSLAVHSAWAGPRFLIIGDWGAGDSGQRRVAVAMKKHCETRACDFIVTVGDNFYPSGVKSVSDSQWTKKFTDIYTDLGLGFYPSLGNHDYDGNVDAQIAYTTQSKIPWHMPSRYYQFRKDNTEFFAIDTEDFTDKQREWLANGLKKSDARWKIVFGHRPIYSYGLHGDNQKLEKSLLPILRESAHWYLAGHDHDKQVLKDESQLKFLVCGTGHETRPVSSGNRTFYSASTLGFCRMDLDETTAQLNIYGLDGKSEYSLAVR